MRPGSAEAVSYESPTTGRRSLRSDEHDYTRKEWLTRFRLGVGLLMPLAVLAGAVGLKANEPFYLWLGVVPAFFGVVSWTKAGKIAKDLDGRVVQIMTGSIVRNESRGGSALLRHGGENLISALWWVARGDVISVRSIGNCFSRRVLVDRKTFETLRDGELVKAEILPLSRLAVTVRHQKLGGD